MVNVRLENQRSGVLDAVSGQKCPLNGVRVWLED